MSGARLVWAGLQESYTEVEETADAVMDAIDNAICNGAGWPRLTTAGGHVAQINPAWIACVIPVLAPAERASW